MGIGLLGGLVLGLLCAGIFVWIQKQNK